MGIIKRDKIVEKGTVYLEEEAAVFSPRGPRLEARDISEDVEIAPEELPMLGPVQEKAERIMSNASRVGQMGGDSMKIGVPDQLLKQFDLF